MRLRGCAGWSAPLLLQITEDRVFSVAVQLLYVSFNMNAQNLIIVKYDKLDRLVIYAVFSKHLQCVYRHTKRYPAGDLFFIIQLDIR